MHSRMEKVISKNSRCAEASMIHAVIYGEAQIFLPLMAAIRWRCGLESFAPEKVDTGNKTCGEK